MSNDENGENKNITTYCEKRIGKTIYRVTNVYLGQFELGKALEDLTVRKILRAENDAAGCKC